VIFAAWGFRTSRRAHQEIGDFFGRRVVSLRLCDPRYYHLDMALCVLDDHTALFHPRAFSARSRSALERAFADAIPVNAHDARSLALNAVCDGHHVLIPAGASRVCDELRERGFYPIEVEMAEFAKAGGGIKCCTLELR
jgi:N-dimethylarginine dimethylaminohydrolase